MKETDTAMPQTNFDTIVYCIGGIIATLLLILLFCKAISYFYDFNKELRYLNDEIKRTDDDEREYYLHKRRMLWLSLLPFVKYHKD